LEDDAGERLSQDVFGEAARNLPHKAVVLALGRGFDGEVLGFHTLFAREARDRLGGGRLGGAEHALLAIGLPLGQPFGAQHQAARGGVEPHGFVRNVELFKQKTQVLERARNHPIGNLLDADFEQERQAHAATSCC
jgi:hypothetical protein